MTKTKKLLSVLLSLIMMLSITAGLDLTAYADTLASDGYEYVLLEDGAAEITDYTGSEGNVTIPSEIDGYSVTRIGDYAFNDCKSLTNVTIPNSVTSIGNFAFVYCSSLTSIDVDSQNQYYTSQDGVLFNKGKTELIQYPEGSARTSYTIPDSVTSIGIGAFCSSRLTSITIPNSITSIGNYAFHECSSLTNVTIPNSVTSIEDSAFRSCSSLTNITIPDSVTSIGRLAFYNCKSLTNVTIPNSVTSIGDSAFGSCDSLTSIAIGNSVTSIGDGAFFNCSNLTSIDVDSQNQYYASQDGVLFNKEKTKLIQYPEGSARTSYTVPDSVTTIGDSAFCNCDSMSNITIPNSVTTIGDSAFCCNSLTSITISDSVKNIGSGAFIVCENLTDVYYNSTISEWNSITIEDANENLTNATIHCVDGIINEVHIHKWNSGVVTKKATCTSTGIKTYTCTECGETRTETIPATGHKYDAGKVTKPATCTSTGIKTYTCTECGETKTETIAKTAHTYKTTTTKATTKKNGKIVKKCSICGESTTTTIYYPKTITLSTTSYTYNGKVRKPSVTVKGSNGKTISASNYTVSYSSGRKNVGNYTVTIKFKGNYSGTVKKTFTIKPKATTISKVTAGKKAFTVKWKKQSTQTTGYQIQYSTSSKFKNAKTVTVSKNKTTSKKISKLKAKKKYYVRVRTYKTVKVNGKNTKIYSSWSKVKTVTTKK